MASIAPHTFATRDGAPFTIRTAEPADAERMFEYLAHIDQTSDFNVSRPGTRLLRDVASRIEADLAHPNQLFILAESQTSIVGELSFHGNTPERMAHHGHLGISVHADWRSRGVGTALLRVLLDWARAHPVIEKICLGVFAENAPAIALYRRMGFWEEARRDGEFKFGPGRYMDDIQMSQWVKPHPR